VTTDNYYSLILDPDTDVSAADKLRIIAKDDTNYINVTDHIVTDTDISTGGIHLDLILNEYYLDLVDFPMYLAEDLGMPTLEQMTGAAVAQMNLNYMWWNSSDDPGGVPDPGQYDNQLILYEEGFENNSGTVSGDYLDASGMLSQIQGKRPVPYLEYGYNFAIYHGDEDYMLEKICTWIDYPAGIKPGHPVHVPGAVPAYGDYSSWMSIRGIHTDGHAYPIPESLSVYGFWVNDPCPITGIGENSYKMVDEWVGTYYRPLNGGLEFEGEYVAICEPPIDEDYELTVVEATEFWDLQPPAPGKGGSDLSLLVRVIDSLVIYAAQQGVQEQLLPYDDDFAEIFEQSYPGKPLLIKNLIEDKHDYYAVPFNNVPTLQPIRRRNVHTPPDEDITLIVVLVDATNGQFKEASWVHDPVKYLKISKSDAREIVYDTLVGMGIDPDELPSRAIQIDLVYRGGYSQFLPEWRVIISELDLEFFVSQDGTLSS